MLGLVTCVEAASLDADLPLLAAVLAAADVGVDVVAWDDPTVEWSTFDTLVLRSTWNYPSRLDEFVAWLDHVDGLADVWNPVPMIEWNIDKRYLADLAGAGLPVVPTRFIAPGADVPTDLDLDLDIVVKPTVGGGSQGIARFTHDAVGARAHLESLHASGRHAMVQPYRHAIEASGETGLVYLAGDFSHGFEKRPLLAGPVEWNGDLFARETVHARTPSPVERALADTVVARLGSTAYARVDLAPGAEGPEILEVELIEPSLYLHLDDQALARAATAFDACRG